MQYISNQFKIDYLPKFYCKLNLDDVQQLNKLLSQNASIQVIDTIEAQLAELIKVNNPGKRLTDFEYRNEILSITKGVSTDQYGVWVYYPWTQKLVHLLEEEDFIKVRTNRNQYKISPEELNVLRNKKVGIIGLSVGQSIAITIATERICGEMRLADFDQVELGNMNRLSNANLYDLGTNKAILTARRIAEIDPFIKVSCLTEGINEENINDFLIKEGNSLDILVEECDSIDVKIISRLKARENRIPVIMDTNDKGMLDIERFDLEPNRLIFHGRLKDLEQMDQKEIVEKLKGLSIEEKIIYLSQIIGMENVTGEMKQSLQEMGKTITGWPQLASAVTLGGAMITDTCRRIFLGKFTKSGRYILHFEDLIN